MELVSYKQCFACHACSGICPQNAIDYIYKDGFSYPQINQELCIDCGACGTVCPALDVNNRIKNKPMLYSYQHLQSNVIKESSSGGAFTAISDTIIERGGAVAGAILDKNNMAVHTIVTSKQARDGMRGAKYVQSELKEDIYKEVVRLLKEKKQVLFSGTPCQVEAIRKYCNARKVECEGLVLCALVCHGASSPDVWKRYISSFVEEHQAKDVVVNFRNKKNGWRQNKITATVGKKEFDLDEYSSLYFSLLCNRESCFTCPFTTVYRNCDITIGDFWSINNFDTSISEEEGVSMILVHTRKGEKLVEHCKNWGSLKRYDYDPQVGLQPALNKPYTKPIEYPAFWKDYKTKSWSFLVKKYTSTSFCQRVRRFIRRKIIAISGGGRR